jgi:hypothetical protein
MKDSFPLPRIDDLLDKLRSAKCTTYLDLRSSYNKGKMLGDDPQDDSIAATSFQGLTPNGASYLLEMLVMGFGLCNALATFSRLMNHVLEPYINKFVIVYLDDICIYSDAHEQHIERLRLVLEKLREHQFFIKMQIFLVAEKRLNILVLLLVMELCEWHQVKSQLSKIGRHRKLKSKLSLLANFALTMVSLFTISRIVLRHLQICVAKTCLVMSFIPMQKPRLKRRNLV